MSTPPCDFQVEAASQQKSKAQLAAEEDARMRQALERPLGAENKGFRMMQKLGYRAGEGLGKAEAAIPVGEDLGEVPRKRPATEPIRVSVGQGRSGIGVEGERRRREEEEVEGEVKRVRIDEGEYRERMRTEREEARSEGLVGAAQDIAERLDEEKYLGEQGGDGEGKLVGKREVNVLWRGRVLRREEMQRERLRKHEKLSNLTRGGVDDGDEEDADDKIALGRTVEDLEDVEEDEEDSELEEFDALPSAEKLEKLVVHLRKQHLYCFWCKYQYESEEMEGCPGLTEEDHD